MSLLRKILEFLLKLFGGNGGNGGGGEECYKRSEAEEIVRELYLEVLGREPDPGSEGYVRRLIDCSASREDVEESLRGSEEMKGRSEKIVRDIYRELLRRDPGPVEPGGPWVDPGAYGYVEAFIQGDFTEDGIRAAIKESDEYKNLPKTLPAKPFRIDGSALYEPENDRLYMPLSISLFYAPSLGIPRGRVTKTLDALAGKVQEARFSMSTFTWGNDQGEPEVIPFKPGDRHEGYSNEISPAFLDELEWRARYAMKVGVRPQITLFWGGFQPMFRRGNDVDLPAMKSFVRATMERSKNLPGVKWEIMNEADHGHHLAYVGDARRKEIISEIIRFAKSINPEAHFGVSDGGRDAGENELYFDYHRLEVLDDWKVHYPRDKVEVRGIPRWCRGLWHLNGEGHEFAKHHNGKAYGQNDENIFLQTEAEHNQYPYGGSTRDWRMVVSSWYVAATARSCSTAHTQKGFFCREGAGEDPAIKLGGPAYIDALKDFAHRGQASLNAGWPDSPITEFETCFKAFALAGGDNRRTMLFAVLDPKQGKLKLNLKRKYRYTVREITGEVKKTGELEGRTELRLPPMNYPKAAVVRLDAV